MRYKVISKLIWEFESNDSKEDCLNQIKKQLSEIVDLTPDDKEYQHFNVYMDLIPIKNKNTLQHIKEYDLEYIFSKITKDDKKIPFKIGDTTYRVKMNSDRYLLFQKNSKCVVCNLDGTKMILDLDVNNSSHFNLYGEENGQLILMTKDHILPKSKGGKDKLSNYQTMCSICNNLKSNFDLYLDQILELRKIYQNNDNLSKKELSEIINIKREELAAPLTIFIKEVL